MAGRLQVGICGRRNHLPNPLHLDLARRPHVQLPGFVPKALRSEAARGGQDVDMVVEPIGRPRRMDAGLDSEPITIDQRVGDDPTPPRLE